jgi:hypothetical protein
MTTKYLVQYEIDGQWFTCAKRASFKSACAKARSEARAMKYAHPTSIIREDDTDAEFFRRRTADNFEIQGSAVA